jgi:hypothetical protein
MNLAKRRGQLGIVEDLRTFVEHFLKSGYSFECINERKISSGKKSIFHILKLFLSNLLLSFKIDSYHGCIVDTRREIHFVSFKNIS